MAPEKMFGKGKLKGISSIIYTWVNNQIPHVFLLGVLVALQLPLLFALFSKNLTEASKELRIAVKHEEAGGLGDLKAQWRQWGEVMEVEAGKPVLVW